MFLSVQAKSPRLWAFLVATYWVSFVTYFLLWRGYKHVSELRADALMSPEVRPQQFAVLVRDLPDLPKGQSRKEQVDAYFKAIYPDTFYRSMVVTNNKEVCINCLLLVIFHPSVFGLHIIIIFLGSTNILQSSFFFFFFSKKITSLSIAYLDINFFLTVSLSIWIID